MGKLGAYVERQGSRLMLAAPLMDRFYIGGEFVRPAAGATDAVVNPATEAVIGDAPVGGLAEIEQAIAAAREAFDRGPWPRMAPAERAAALERFHAELIARRAVFEQLLVIEAGCTTQLSSFMFDYPMKHLRFAIQMLGREHVQIFPPVIAPNMGGGLSVLTTVVEREPIGVVAAITAYNFPFSIAIFKIAAALAMGNTMVLKPSPFTPFVTLAIAQAAHAAGFPPGVLNIITGGAAEGAVLTSDPRVDMVSFTGSDGVGSAIMAQAAPTLKRTLLELGGKSAMIVRADADMAKAVPAGVMSFTMHCGQGCALNTRHIVHNSIRKAYVAALKAAVGVMSVGDPADPATAVGPLIRASARDRVERYVEEAKASGATLAFGGRRPPGLDVGYYFEPTVFDDVANTSALSQDEIFGPVAAVIGFDTDEEAVALANASPFGLSGAVFSRDVGRAYEMARQVRTGGIQVNCVPLDMSAFSSMGGVKRSGIGRELGLDGLYAYTSQKSITMEAG
ncbi:MAG: aldehyde dehydrogenase [Caulobacter sp.]|nr:aldehyde dehydrogenase [Caulobacter sp.]